MGRIRAFAEEGGRQVSTETPSAGVRQDPIFEAMFTPRELAELWKFHPSTIQRMFKDEPGVLVYGEENRRDSKRDYTTIRIPASVAKGVYERLRRH